MTYPFNHGWLYAPHPLELDARDDAFTAQVTLPHTNLELPRNSFDHLEYQFISTYRRRFTLPEALRGRRLYIEFDGAMTSASVWLNGHFLGEHDGGYTPFTFDLTPHLSASGEQVLHVRLDSTERPDVPPNGMIVDYLTFGGIYREVRLRLIQAVHVADAFVRPQQVLSGRPSVEIDVTLRNQTDAPQAVVVQAQVTAAGGAAVAGMTGEGRAEVPPQGETTLTLHLGAGEVVLWSLEQPALYQAHIGLAYAASPDTPFDVRTERFGFREAVFRDDGFYLNGDRLHILGLNRHQTYPYIGGAAPARLQRLDAEILKHQLGVNLVRTSHYPQSPHFLDRCDELGLLVFEEIPGWQWIGDNDWKALSLKNVEAMIVRDRNRPSIVLWGVRINESMDDEALYTASNALARRLDPTRQTGGVRFFLESQFLEDVFTYNDFSNGVAEPVHTPHLISEHNGHMFPTKPYDSEERQQEHALRHARVQDLAYGNPRVTGAIGWCAFDYNTHREFGSGDRVCYHGVMDLFRLPKFAAALYESQIDPRVRPMVRAATFWTFGERAGAGVEPLYVFSNCEAIEVYRGDELHGRFEPARDEFPHLPHPPFRVMGFPLLNMFGFFYQELRVVGLIDGQPVAEHRIAADGVPHALTLALDHTTLDADGSDMTRLVFRVVDRYGNRQPFHACVVQFEIEGDAELVGENPFALIGGQAALFVRAGHTPGRVTITARTPRLAEVQVALDLQPVVLPQVPLYV